MELPWIPLNNLSSSSSSSLHFSVLPPNTDFTKTLKNHKVRVFCCQKSLHSHTRQPQLIKVSLESTKKKNKKKNRRPRPSFYDQIRDKWSLKLGSQREKFPWQEETQKEGLRYVQISSSSEANLSETKVEVKKAIESKPLSYKFPNPVISAPWNHGYKPTNKDGFNCEPNFAEEGSCDELARKCEDDIDDGVFGREEIVEEDVIGNGEVGRNFDGVSNSIGAKWKKEIEVTRRDFLGDKTLNDGEGQNGDTLELPWKKISDGFESGERDMRRRSNTELAERMLPEHELRRLRSVALRMLERFKVGSVGITQELVDSMHEKWKVDEVVKLKFEGPHSANMRRTHETLERKTGGLVIWRSGSLIVLYRGMAYKLPCVRSYAKQNVTNVETMQKSRDIWNGATRTEESVSSTKPLIPDQVKYSKNLSGEELTELSDLNKLLDALGPRFKDWSGREPLPVDADLLPAVVPGYKPPFRLLPHGVRHSLKDKEMTVFRRFARMTAPHFALGRSRELQGLAQAMVKLWGSSAIAKIAIKRGVENTRNERMAEELKKLTGGTLLSRNKEYIVFYRGNDFLPPDVTDILNERQKLTHLKQEEEEEARKMASSSLSSNGKTPGRPLLAGTLAETMAATSHWGNQPNNEDVEIMRRDSDLKRRASLIKTLQNKLAIAKAKVKKAELALEKVQDYLKPVVLPTDLETITDEERFLFRKMGLSMKPYLLLGRRGVYSGTIENMHLHWKYRELVKIIVKGKSFSQVKQIAIALEAESGGVLVSLDKTTKGYAIIVYRGKNYLQPRALRPDNLLSRRQALARSIELQRRESLKRHISNLEERMKLLKAELEAMKNGKMVDGKETLSSSLNDPKFASDDMIEDEGEEAYLEIYEDGSEDGKNKNLEL